MLLTGETQQKKISKVFCRTLGLIVSSYISSASLKRGDNCHFASQHLS